MIVSLSKEAKAQLLHTSKRANLNPETYVKGLLEQLFKPNSMYMILNPIPSPDRLNALKVSLEGILNMPEFFGFKFLTKEEATQEAAVHSKFAWCDNCRKVRTVSFEGFVNENRSREFVGGDLVCDECKSIAVTLYRPKTLLEIVAESDSDKHNRSETSSAKPELKLTTDSETPAERIKRVIDFPKPAEELMLYDYLKLKEGQTPEAPWVLESSNHDEKTNMWRRPHECQTVKDFRCDVCGRLG